MLQNIEHKGGIMMAKSADTEAKKADKQALGRLIKESRGKRSLRSVANAVGLPPSTKEAICHRLFRLNNLILRRGSKA